MLSFLAEFNLQVTIPGGHTTSWFCYPEVTKPPGNNTRRSSLPPGIITWRLQNLWVAIIRDFIESDHDFIMFIYKSFLLQFPGMVTQRFYNLRVTIPRVHITSRYHYTEVAKPRGHHTWTFFHCQVSLPRNRYEKNLFS